MIKNIYYKKYVIFKLKNDRMNTTYRLFWRHGPIYMNILSSGSDPHLETNYSNKSKIAGYGFLPRPEFFFCGFVWLGTREQLAISGGRGQCNESEGESG